MIHSFLHGDASKVLEKIKDNTVHLVVTSPPYFNAKKYKNKENNIGRNENYQGYLDKIENVIEKVYDVIVPGGYICFNTSPVIDSGKRYAIPFDTHPLFIKHGFLFKEDVIWRKPNGCSRLRCGAWLQNNHRPTTWHGNAISESINIYKKPGNREKKEYKENQFANYGQDIKTNVWEFNPSYIKWHDAPFPFELAKRCLLLFSYEGDTVLDPFAGTFTLTRVAKRYNRNSIGIELSKGYIEQSFNEVSKQKTLLDENNYEFFALEELNSQYIIKK